MDTNPIPLDQSFPAADPEHRLAARRLRQPMEQLWRRLDCILGRKGRRESCFLVFIFQKNDSRLQAIGTSRTKSTNEQSKLSLISIPLQLNPPAALLRRTILRLHPVRSNVSLGFKGSGDTALDDRQLADNSGEDGWEMRISEGHSEMRE